MRSTTGKMIKFTLQRTPTWAWAGMVLPTWSVPVLDMKNIEFEFSPEGFLELLDLMGVPPERFGIREYSNRQTAYVSNPNADF